MLTNRKPEHRRGKVQLIDAPKWFRPLRKNLGKKNCELGEEDIAGICDTFLAFEETEQSRTFDNAALGYWKVTVERPLRIEGADSNRVYKAAEIRELELKENGKRSEEAPAIIRKIHKRGTEADPLHGLFAATVDGQPAVVEYEPDTDLRDGVRAVIDAVPGSHTEMLEVSDEAERLAATYVDSGALGPSQGADALHVALASLARVDVLASWNFRHMVSLRRIRAYNDVNRRLGCPALDIRTPKEMNDAA